MRSLGLFFASIFWMLAFTLPAQATPGSAGPSLQLVSCGNLVIEAGEDCDDGNTAAGDCCSPTCQFESASTECRPAAGVCDAPDNCDGAGSCTPDAKLTSECRASVSVCDIAESCDGVGDDCPADAFEPPTTECRASAGICDPPSFCDGTSPLCPSPCFPIVCRDSTGPCDPEEWCEARYLPCPPDVIYPPGTVCRGSAGLCDPAEVCNGVSVFCPADSKEPDTTACRADAGDCDIADFCDGVSDECPMDAFEPEGTSCDDGNGQTQNDQCDDSGVCMGTPNAVPAMSPWGQLLVGLFVFVSGAALLVQRGRAER